MDQRSSGLFVPDQVNAVAAQPGVASGRPGPVDGPDGVIIDNRTGLPDDQIRAAVMSHFVETAAFQFGHPSSFQMYATNQGSMLQRAPFHTPANVVEEIKLARTIAETDDDVTGIIGAAISTAFRDGMQNLHEDERTVQLFNRMCASANMDSKLKELMREWLISAQVNTVSLFTRQRHSFIPTGTEDRLQEQLATPRIGVLPAENIRVVGTDLFNDADLAYDVPDQNLKDWLTALFSDRTSEAVKSKMRRENPVAAALFTGIYVGDWNDPDILLRGQTLFKLNPSMCHRSTMPKGASAYPRPPLTSNFALLEAKRLLNVMDYALLQGGTNYIVVAKVGSDAKPGMQPEVDNLEAQVRSAARTGVLVGDHRVSIEIITPDLTSLLSAEKRKLIGRAITRSLLRIPEQVTDDAGGAEAELEFIANSITSDRHDLKRHVEGSLYDEIVQRNRGTFTKGSPRMWFQKIVLNGVKDFFDQVVKARDRGDIPRKWAVEVLGFDYEAGVAQRKRETERGDDEIMKPGSVPFNSPDNQAPTDGGGNGRPPGASSSNGRPGGAPGGQVDPAQHQRQPSQLIPRRRGAEAVRAVWDVDQEATVRFGVLTASILEQFPDRTLGRVTDAERRAANGAEVIQEGPLIAVPVNTGQEWRELRAFRLDDGVGMIVGQRHDGALMAAALCFRDSAFTEEQAVERAVQWGFYTSVERESPEAHAEVASANPVRDMLATAFQTMGPEAFASMAAKFVSESLAGLQPQVTIVMPEEGDKEIVRDEETGAIIGTRRRAPEVQS